MKKLKTILALASIIVSLAGCTTSKPLAFRHDHWTLRNNGHIANTDSTCRFFVSEGIIREEMPIIDCMDSVAKYPGMDKHLRSILKDAHLTDSEILFYAPEEFLLIVKAEKGRLPWKPVSMTSGMNEERPFTAWIYDDDPDEGSRRHDEIYTYTFFNKRMKRVLVVDFFDYGTMPIAQIRVLQTMTKKTDKMGLPHEFAWSFLKHDLSNYKREFEYWGHTVEAHRKIAFENYRLGQKLKKD